MKVLYLIDTLEIGGAERSLLNILRRFRQTEAVICHLYPGETLKPEYETAGIPVISLNIPARYAFGVGVTRVRQVILRQRPDLLQTTLFRADVVGRLAGWLGGVPVVSSLVNESYHPARWAALSRTRWLKLKGVQVIDRLTARLARHFLAVSASTRRSNCDALGLSPHKVTVIYRGRDPAPFLTATPAPDLPQSGPLLLNVGRILKRKGQLDLIRAMAVVRRRFPGVRLLIAGEGHDRPLLEAEIQELGLQEVVGLLGQRQDVPRLLRAADMFVFPSHYEGHPGALVEAMFAARPIIASDIPVHRETLTPGRTGQLAPVADPSGLAAEIEWLLAHPTEGAAMGQQARVEAMDRFHIDRVAARYEEFYHQILS